MSYVRKKIIFDTSSLIPVCLHPDREPASIFRHCIINHDIFASDEVLEEIFNVLSRPKFDAWQEPINRSRWFYFFKSAVKVLNPEDKVNDCRDEKDNKFLELAIAVNADLIISSDVHLLELNPYNGIEIIRLSDFKDKYI